MLDFLQPDYYYKDIFNIDLDLFLKKGYKGIICDIDNTIVPWSEKEIMEEVIEWIQKIKREDFALCLVSNGMDKRVNYFSQELSIPAVGQAVKPRKKSYKRALNILGLKSEITFVIGDQIFTDILGGNRLGLTTVLVDPMSSQEFITTKILRMLERVVFTRGEPRKMERGENYDR